MKTKGKHGAFLQNTKNAETYTGVSFRREEAFYSLRWLFNIKFIKEKRISRMNKVAVVYWSGTGNTELMAAKVAEGVRSAGAEVVLIRAAEFSGDRMDEFDAVAFGCPSMGVEQLEETEFEPMFLSCEPKLKGKKIALFGSYGWGDGEWMRAWEQTCTGDGAVLAHESVICNDAPDAEAEAACAALGASLA